MYLQLFLNKRDSNTGVFLPTQQNVSEHFFSEPLWTTTAEFFNENKASENKILIDGFTYSEVSHTDHIAW